jgi:predicted phosphoadenosine phosphosulfate sulfurtransferase
MQSDNQKRQVSGNTGIRPTAVQSIPRAEAARAIAERKNKNTTFRSTAKTVLEAANERIALAFRDFDKVLVAFSCGKDSGVMLNLTYQYAKKNNLLHKMAFYYEDYEAGYKYTHEYAERTFKELNECERYWLCLPISAACSASMYQSRWIPWDEDLKHLWVRDFPKGKYVITMDNVPYQFIKGTKGFDARIQFAQWFSKTYGNTAVLVGIRMDESLTRRGIITSPHRSMMHKNLPYTKTVDEVTCNFYPLYDWRTQDIWVANAKFGFDYNKIYDLYYQAGLNIDQMRVASPFHQSGQENLKLYKVIDPNTWGKMVGRVNGVNFTGIYGGTTAMGWKSITKPSHFTWKQYAEFLMSTLPAETKKKLEFHLARLAKSWNEKGYGRNPDVIRSMLEEGIELENTHVICKKCTKDNIYEIVKIKSGFPDDTKVHNLFRICPSWKGICITIMKNDFTCLYLGASRTRDQNILRQKALEKYNRVKVRSE